MTDMQNQLTKLNNVSKTLSLEKFFIVNIERDRIMLMGHYTPKLFKEAKDRGFKERNLQNGFTELFKDDINITLTNIN